MDDGVPSRGPRIQYLLQTAGLFGIANISLQDALPALVEPINQNLEQWCTRLMERTFEVRHV